MSAPASPLIVTSAPELIMLSLPLPPKMSAWLPEFVTVSLPASALIFMLLSVLVRLSADSVPLTTVGFSLIVITLFSTTKVSSSRSRRIILPVPTVKMTLELLTVGALIVPPLTEIESPLRKPMIVSLPSPFS